jgi:hypothetical protein
MTPSPVSWPWGRWVLYVIVLLLTGGFRYLTMGDGIPNDHFVHISGGWQMLSGEWPTRDWVDPGTPLMFVSSALSQLLLGQTLVAEAVLVAVAFALGAALTAAVVHTATGSLALALLATVLEVAIVPRTYSYPKVLVYALGFLCFLRYVERPGMGRLVSMAAAIVVGFLFRHDHGLFLAVGGTLAVLLSPQPAALSDRCRQAATLAGAVLMMVLPYLLYVQFHVGLRNYLETGISFSRVEAARQWHVWPAVFGDEYPFFSALVYELHVLPLLALCAVVALRRHERAGYFRAFVVPVSVVAVMANFNFIRDPLATRLPDAIVPGVVLGAWLLQRAWQARPLRPAARVLAVASGVVFSLSVLEAGNTVEVIDRADLINEWDHLQRLTRNVTSTLRATGANTRMPSRASESLKPFFSYLERCTTAEDRLLVGGYLVELPFIARRRFAAGQQYFGGSFVGTPESQSRMLSLLQRQRTPFAVIPADEAAAFQRGFPQIAAYVDTHYMLMGATSMDGGGEVRILVDSRIPPAGDDAATGWPCFLSRARDN